MQVVPDKERFLGNTAIKRVDTCESCRYYQNGYCERYSEIIFKDKKDIIEHVFLFIPGSNSAFSIIDGLKFLSM